MKTIVLASNSPRRKQLLEQIGLSFKIITHKVDESYNINLKHHEIVEQLSYKKAQAVANTLNFPAVVIGADTIVSLNNKVILKPKDKNDAYNILKKLNGTKHSVYTGMTLIDNVLNKNITRHDKTDVYMRYINDFEIQSYINSEEPLDKAGAYGIQDKGALFIEKIIGDYYNVVGLSLYGLYQAFNELGLNII